MVLVTLSPAIKSQITISLIDKAKSYSGDVMTARIDFYSEESSLVISEYKGTPVSTPVKQADGRYLYTCICDVNDDNQFTFEVKRKGDINNSRQNVYIEAGQFFEYLVEVENPKMAIEDIRLNETIVVPESNTAKVIISSEYDQLHITSPSGEPVDGPIMTGDGLWRYTISYDMTSPASREIERHVYISTSEKEDPIDFLVGRLQPKEGKDIVVVVIEETCFDYNIRIGKKFWAECNYLEAFHSYREAFKCSTIPHNTQKEYQEMRKVNGLARLQEEELKYWNKARDLNTPLDSVIFFYRKSKIYRMEILEHSPNDLICHSHENAEKKLPRIVTGVIRYKGILDASGQNMPIEGAYITLCEHERKKDKEKGYTTGKEFVDRRQVFRSNASGYFAILVPRNTEDIIYALRFTIGELKQGNTDPFVFVPTDADTQDIKNILLTPDSNFFGRGGVNNN